MQYKFYLNDVEIDEPLGWDSAELTINKDLKTFGLNFSYVSELEFINNGYSILKTAFETTGIESIVYLEIFMQCNEYSEFEQIFKGKANFTSYKRKISDFCSVVVNFEEENNSILISQNIDKKYDIATDKTITLHPKYVLENTIYESDQIDSISFIPENSANINMWTFTSLNLPWSENPLNTAQVPPEVYFQASLTNCTSVEEMANFYAPFDLNTVKVIIDVKGTFNIPFLDTDIPSNWAVGLGIKWGNETTCNYHLIPDLVVGDTNSLMEGTFTCNTSYTISNLLQKDSICLLFAYYKSDTMVINPSAGIEDAWVKFDRNEFLFTIQTTTAGSDTTCKVVTVNEAFKQVCENLIGANSYQSDFFSSEKIALTNGFKIRQFEKPLTLSFQDLLNGLFPIYGIGYGFVNGILRVEPIEFFFENNLSVLNFNEVFEITETTKNDLIYNTLNVGYEKWGTEQGTTKNNTLDAFCTPHTYNTTITQHKNEFKAVSKFIADAYSIEYTRRQQYLTTPTNQWVFDNDTFVICLNENENGAEKDENIIFSKNVLSPETQYNFRISTARNLLRLNKIFSIGYAKNDTGFANFSSADANFIMQTKYLGSYSNQALDENINLVWNDIYNDENIPLFDPSIFEFEYPLSYQAYLTIKNNPNKTYQITRIGAIIFTGYLLNLNYKPNEGIANFIFIAKNSGSDGGCQVDYVEVDYVECDYVE
jgi:hypothetical protein